MKSSQRPALILIVLIIVPLIAYFLILPSLNYIPPGTPPVNSPAVGIFDTRYHQVNRTILATDQLGDIDSALFYYAFPTNGENTCLYGNFTSDRPVNFIITDLNGLDTYRSSGVLERYKEYVSDVHQQDWELVLAPWLEGEYVERWYVVISSFGYFWMEYDRHVSYYVCEDKTAPYVEMYVPKNATGPVTLHARITDLHCSIESVRVYINSTEKLQDNPNSRICTETTIWNTAAYANGVYAVEVFVRDSAGNYFTYLWWSQVINPSAEELAQVQQEWIIQFGGIASGFIAIVLVLFKGVRERKGALPIVLVLMIFSILSTTTTTTEPPSEWGLWDYIAVTAQFCGITSFIIVIVDRFRNWLRKRPPKLKRTPDYIG